MSEKYDTENNRDRDDDPDERYAAFTADEENVVIYDTQNRSAWLKSDAAVDVAAMD